jgi:hypothetical protein
MTELDQKQLKSEDAQAQASTESVLKGDFTQGMRTEPVKNEGADFARGERTVPPVVEGGPDYARGERTLPPMPEGPDYARGIRGKQGVG